MRYFVTDDECRGFTEVTAEEMERAACVTKAMEGINGERKILAAEIADASGSHHLISEVMERLQQIDATTLALLNGPHVGLGGPSV
jgi:hypothetical protein